MKKILSYIVIISLFLIAGMKTSAIDGRYKNNLLNVELAQTPDNRVSVLLVFEKPYTDPVKVIYKTDNEYNILLPETYHSITSVSTLNALNIRNASVKLVPYFNQDNSNGYTKITLQTTRPVVFNAHASYITTQIAQNELIDKIEKDDEFKIVPTKVAINSSAKKQSNTVKTKSKSIQVKPTQTTKPVVKQSVKVVTKPVQNVVNKPKTNDVSVSKTAAVSSDVVPSKNVNVLSDAVKEKEVLTVENQEARQSELVSQNQSETSIDANKDVNVAQKVVSSQNKNDILQQVQQFKNNNMILPFAIVGILLIMIFRALKKNNKRVYSEPVAVAPVNSFDYGSDVSSEVLPQELNELSWQEKYKYMKEKGFKNTQNSEINELNIDENDVNLVPDDAKVTEYANHVNEFDGGEPLAQTTADLEEDNILSQDNEDGFVQNVSYSNIELKRDRLPKSYVDMGDELVTYDENIENAISLDDMSDMDDVDLMYQNAPDKEDIEPLAHEVEINESRSTNPIEPTLINQAKISKSKGFYLVRYENEVALMGYINEQIFLLHTFNKQKPSFVQTRLTEKQKGAEVYLVRSENYKSLIKVTKDSMQTLMTL